ncbi:MAG TPA: hypothetical protein VGS21_01430, partial [Acidimicrobiales bacterium]|nr:hypothetical protein [Acidimicrobiales bacterium]
MSVGQLAGQLEHSLDTVIGSTRGGEARQRTLRAAVDWSYELLGQAERVCLRRLSVFQGGFTPEAASAVVGDALLGADDIGADEIARVLPELVAGSLVEMDTSGDSVRYRLLEPIRQWAWSRLDEAGETEASSTAHLAYYMRYVVPFGGLGLRGPYGVERIRSVDVELANVRTAIRFALDSGRGDEAAAITSALRLYWVRCGHYREADEYCAQALEMSIRTESRARMLQLRSLVAMYRADSSAAVHIEAAVELFAEFGDRDALARARMDRAFIRIGIHPVDVLSEEFRSLLDEAVANRDSWLEADLVSRFAHLQREAGSNFQAMDSMQRALRLYRAVGEHSGIAVCLEAIGRWQSEAGELDAAAESLEESMAHQRALGSSLRVAMLQMALTEVVATRGDYEAARDTCALALPVLRDLGALSYGWAICRSAVMEELCGSDALAGECALRAREVNDAMIDRRWSAESDWVLARVAIRRGELAAACSHLAVAFAANAEPAQPARLADLVTTCGALALAADRADLARRLVRAGTAWRVAQGMTPFAVDIRDWVTACGLAENIGDERDADTLDEAIALARGLVEELG